ncbi:MAG: SDR family oxidoreductase [Gaiellaceae bacterium]
MKLLVTGASGYLGSELVRRALAAGHDVVACARTRRPAASEACLLDLRDAAAVAALLELERPGGVIHTAYLQDGPEAWSTNVDGTQNVASAARSVGARLLHLSTDLVFDGESSRPYREEDKPWPIMLYGLSKLEAERRVAATDPAALVVRSALLYGGREPSRHERLALDAAAGRAEAVFFSDEIRTPVSVADVAAALLELLEIELGGVLHLAGPESVSRYQLARALVRAAGGDAERLRPGSAAGLDPPRPPDCSLDASRARSLLSTRLRTLGEALGAPAAKGANA